MRNLKKVLTLVLTLAMLLSVMVVGAGAATFGDQDSITNKEAVDVCTTLNIIGGYEDGTFRPAGNVTRAEMSKMICVALNGGQEPTMGSGLIATFNDVAKDNWAAPYIEYCVSQGIVGGVGGGNFNPNGNITGTQAAKMLLCILGYNASIQGYVGSDYWETNINVDAAQKGLYAGLSNVDASAPLTRDQAAQMIWNALNAYEVEYKTTLVAGPDGTLTSKVTVQDKVVAGTTDKITLLEDKYEAKTFVGNFTAVSEMNTATMKDGYIKLHGALNSNGDATDPASTGYDATFPYDLDIKYIGEEVKVIYKDKVNDGKVDLPDDKDTIYGVYVTNGTTVVNAIRDDIDGTYTTAGKVSIDDKSYEVAATGTIITDLGAVANDSWATTTEGKSDIQGLAAVNGDTVKFILNDQNKIESVYVTTTTLNKVTAVSGSKISLSGIGSIDTAENGTTVYSGVAKDDIVTVTKLYDADIDDATFVIEKAETVTGDVTAYSGTPNKSITMNGTVYKVYNEANMPTIVDRAKVAMNDDCLDNEFTLYLVNGYVRAAQEGEDSMNNYAIVMETNPGGVLDSTFHKAEAKLLLADGTEVVATLHKDSTIYDDNKVDGTAYTSANKVNTLDDLQVNQIVKYSVMSNGQYKIEETGVYAKTSTALYNKDTKTFDGVVTSGDCVLFYTNNVSGDLKAANIRNLNSITVSAGKVYAAVTNSDGKVVAAFIDNQARPSGAASDTLYGIIMSDNGGTQTTYKGDTYTMYEVWTGAADGKATTVYVDGASAKSLNKGALVSFEKSSDDTYTQGTAFTVLNGTSGGGHSYPYGLVAPVAEYNNTDRTVTVANTLTYANNAYTAATKTTYHLDDDAQIVYVDADNSKAGADNGGDIPEFDAGTGYANVLLVFDENNDTKNVVAVIVNTNSDVNVLGVKAALGANSVTAPTTPITGRGLTATVVRDKAYASAGETITYTVTVSGSASAASKITISSLSNSTVGDVVVSGEGWTRYDTSTAYVESGKGAGTIKFTVTADGHGVVGAPTIAFAAQ